ncbi:hypothetical protein [Lacrimispora sp. 38-1]|uniref:hypothetical protein n=1 Tax=Lacrimispora sp. 38-1 TaxID=3125778 RepID=UPI003CF285F2
METTNKKLLNSYISREIIKIILKFACTLGLTYLAVKYDFFTKGTGTLGYAAGIFLTFCIIYFLCSVMQVALQTCRSVIAAIIEGVILIAILMAGLSLLPGAIQGYVFVVAVVIAILYDLIRMVLHAKMYEKE